MSLCVFRLDAVEVARLEMSSSPRSHETVSIPSEPGEIFVVTGVRTDIEADRYSTIVNLMRLARPS